MAFAVWWLLFKTTLGFEIRTVGANPNAARYGGIKITRITVLTMAISGGLAGLAGSNEVLGLNHFLASGFSAGYGFDAIALALLGKSHPLGVVLASLLFGTLRNGATRMQSIASIPNRYYLNCSGAGNRLYRGSSHRSLDLSSQSPGERRG